MSRGTVTLARSPMARGSAVLKAKAPIARTAKPMKARSKTNANPRPKTGHAELCRGQPCYLAIPGVCQNARETVVPAHSNQQKHGKGRGIKAHDEFTVPACFHCHAILDQGAQFSREEKFALWDAAYERWRPVRAQLMEAPCP